METSVLETNENSIDKAAELLKNGEIVGIPTETVYGLAANALNTEAVRKIFAAKGRPQDNPLILHIANLKMLDDIAAEIPELALTLAHKFWPGSLTMIFPKKPHVPLETTGGLETAAVRMPNNKWTLKLIEKCGFPLAAPSANTSGLPSPTEADHVFRDMNGKIPLILDGGSCSCGVESTVICFTEKGVKILRPGAVTVEMLREFTDVEVDKSVLSKLDNGEKPLSPGMKYKHYSPKAEVIIVQTDNCSLFTDYVNKHGGENVYVLAYGTETGIKAKQLPYGKTAEEQAATLFASLRKADEIGAERVYVRSPHTDGIGLAVYNRLLRSAGFNVVKL